MNPLSKYQAFEAKDVERSQIKNAVYNPRHITPTARKKLTRTIETLKLREPLVWNKRTGNLVSGHQRISILDDLQGNDAYSLTMSVIDVSDAEEKAINVAFNNTEIQGSFDFDLLHGIALELVDSKLAEKAGFDQNTLVAIFGDEFASKEAKEQAANEAPIVEQLNAIYEAGSEARKENQHRSEGGPGSSDETKQALKDRRKEFNASRAEQDEAEFYLSVVFRNAAEAGETLEKLGLDPSERFVAADDFWRGVEEYKR